LEVDHDFNLVARRALPPGDDLRVDVIRSLSSSPRDDVTTSFRCTIEGLLIEEYYQKRFDVTSVDGQGMAFPPQTSQPILPHPQISDHKTRETRDDGPVKKVIANNNNIYLSIPYINYLPYSIPAVDFSTRHSLPITNIFLFYNTPDW